MSISFGMRGGTQKVRFSKGRKESCASAGEGRGVCKFFRGNRKAERILRALCGPQMDRRTSGVAFQQVYFRGTQNLDWQRVINQGNPLVVGDMDELVRDFGVRIAID